MKNRVLFLSCLILISGIITAQTTPESSEALLKKAFVRAAEENKNVFVIFHASWCGWCKKLDASINDPSCSDFFYKNYLFVHLVVLESKDKKNLENPGAPEMFIRYAGEKQGIPFFLIFDKNGVLLADSKIRVAGEGLDKPGQNMGCPAADEEVSAFINVLRKTSGITDKEVSAVSERFKKNRN